MAAKAGVLRKRTVYVTRYQKCSRAAAKRKTCIAKLLTWKHGKLRKLAFGQHEHNDEETPQDQHGDDHWARGRELQSNARYWNQEQDGAGRAEEDTQLVDLRQLHLQTLRWELLRRKQQVENQPRTDSQGPQEPEQGYPGGSLGEGRGDERPNSVTQANTRTENPNELAPALECRHVRHNHHRQGHDAAGPDAADTPEQGVRARLGERAE